MDRTLKTANNQTVTQEFSQEAKFSQLILPREITARQLWYVLGVYDLQPPQDH